jgi:hypothetical protein
MLEVQIDHAGRSAFRRGIVQLIGGFDCKRRASHTARSWHEGINLRFGIVASSWPLQRPDAGPDEFGGGQRLDKEIGNLQLEHDPRRARIEFFCNDNHRRLPFQAPDKALEGFDFLQTGRIHVDNNCA